MTPVRWFRRRARPPKMPNWTHRAFALGRVFHPVDYIDGKVRAPKGYAFNGRGDLVSLKREARRERNRA